jgi:hypothetical protein
MEMLLWLTLLNDFAAEDTNKYYIYMFIVVAGCYSTAQSFGWVNALTAHNDEIVFADLKYRCY